MPLLTVVLQHKFLTLKIISKMKIFNCFVEKAVLSEIVKIMIPFYNYIWYLVNQTFAGSYLFENILLLLIVT